MRRNKIVYENNTSLRFCMSIANRGNFSVILFIQMKEIAKPMSDYIHSREAAPMNLAVIYSKPAFCDIANQLAANGHVL